MDKNLTPKHEPQKPEGMKLNIRVEHYGPNHVPDADHSTYISVDYGNNVFQEIALSTDEELVYLIELLQFHLQQGDRLL